MLRARGTPMPDCHYHFHHGSPSDDRLDAIVRQLELLTKMIASVADYITAMHVEERHCNRAMLMHGAMMSMLFDTAFYYAARQQYEASIGIVTGHLALDFVGTAKPGDWVEAHVEIVRTGRNICYLTGFAWNNGERIGSASAQFLTVDRTKRPLQN